MGKLIEELIWSTQTIFPTGSQLGLVTKKQSPVANFVSRKDLLAEMRDALDGDYRYLLISGIGGSGKSELARKYITEYAAQYDNICMLEYWGNIRETINHGVQFYDDTMCYDYEKLFQDSTRQELFLKKINLLNKLNKAILVIDNFENFADENLRYLLDLNISIILLTREDVATELNHIDITDKMTKAQQKQLFMAYCEVDLESSLIEKLCEACFGHPMTIVLLARIISSKRYTINDIFEKFKNLNKNSLDEPIVYGRDKVYKRQKVSEHIKSLIEIVGLSLIQKQILLDISFSSPFPLQQDYFYKHYPLNNTDLKFLINLNLIKIDQELILIHPLLAESILELIHPDIIKCSKLLDYYNRSYFKRNLGKIYIANMAKKIALYFTKGSLQYYEMMYAGAGYWFDQSEYEISRKIYYYLHELLQENSNIERMADIECKIALVYKYQGKYSDAITIYEQLLYLCNKNSKFNQNLEVRAWIGLGNIYHMLAESEKNVINQKLAKKYFYGKLRKSASNQQGY